MASQIEIANWAMMMLGEKRLTSLSEDAANAEMVSGGWDQVRDVLIASAAWRDFIERDSIAADATEPAWGFSYQYTIPGNVVRVLQVGEFYPGADLSDYRVTDAAPYRLEQGKILTDMGAPLSVKWLINDVDIGAWRPAFAKLMACDLADYMNTRVTESDAAAQRIAIQRQQAWMFANMTNAIEDPPDEVADGSWITAHAL